MAKTKQEVVRKYRFSCPQCGAAGSVMAANLKEAIDNIRRFHADFHRSRQTSCQNTDGFCISRPLTTTIKS